MGYYHKYLFLSSPRVQRFSKDIIDNFAEAVQKASLALSPIARKFIDYFWVVESYLQKTLFAQNNTVFFIPSTSLCYGYTRHMVRCQSKTNILTTPGAVSTTTLTVLPALSRKGCTDSSLSKSHNKSSPSYFMVPGSYSRRRVLT